MTLPASTRSKEPIAIIGTGLRFPGDVNNPTQLWDLLQHPRDVRTSIPTDRFSMDGFCHPSHDNQGTSHTRHGYFLSGDIRKFDTEFFGIKPVEASSMDPQQRLLLEVVYESIEAAGLNVEALRGSPTAVYVGLMAVDYNDMLNRDTSDFPPYVAAGNSRSIISNRVSHFFDWQGPSMTIDTACSSSLVAVHLAIQSLRSGDCTLAIAAGANLMLGPETFIVGSDMKMLSPDGRSYWCDARANGYARGEGIAAIVLKTLSAAIADGDDIECVIAETGLNQDGRTQGLTVPSADAQATLIRTTYKKAGLDLTKPSDRPQYFEAHGTGTPTGDPIEIKAIYDAFFGNAGASDHEDRLSCGSVKTIIGHTEGTAGLAGLIKTSLALRHGIIPPTFLLESLAPSVKPFFSNLKIPTTAEPWPDVTPGAVRRASVNSFGFGGTNAHCILESYDSAIHGQASDCVSVNPLVFSAPSQRALFAVLRSFLKYLDTEPAIDLRALSHTLCARRTAFSVRMAFHVSSLKDLRIQLESTIEQEGAKSVVTATVSAPQPQILGIFTGQGAQWAGMASRLMQYPGAITAIGELERSLDELPDPPSWSLKAELSRVKLYSRITETAIAQPACTAIQILLVDMLRAAGIHFSAVVGHSSGEIAAAYAAGYLSARDAIRVAYYRGRHVHLIGGKNGERGSMIAIGASFEEAQNLCDRDEFRGRICVAASNSAASVTLSGDISAVEEVEAMFKASNKFARMLRVDNAYHSHHMIRCSEAITASYRACKITSQRPAVPNSLWISSVYHRDIALVTDSIDGQYWYSNTVGEVLFSQALEHALQKINFDLAVEVGAHPALKGPALQVIEDTIGRTIPYTGTLNRGLKDEEAFANTLGYIWTTVANINVDFASFDRFMTAKAPPALLKGLPTYPWNHERAYWHESRISRAYRNRSARHELLGLKSADYSDDQISWKNSLVPDKMSWLRDHRIQGQMMFPGAAYIVSAFEAARQVAGEQPVKSIELTDFVFDQPLVFVAEDSRMETLTSLHGIRRIKAKTSATFTYHSIASKGSGPMIRNAHCQLIIHYGNPNEAILQSFTKAHFGMQEVDSDRIYESFAKYGHQYTGPFRSLTSVSRRLGAASGLIRIPSGSGAGTMMHPATLDAALHSIMVAHSYPGDGRLRTSRVPTEISKISLDLSAVLQSSSHCHLRFLSRSIDHGERAEGELELSLANSADPILQLEGLRTKPVVLATPENDIHMFSETVWGPAIPLLNNDNKVSNSFPDVVQRMTSAAEQVSHRYPGMHILGINAAALDDEKRFLSGLDHAFASYTHTDACGDGFELCRSVLDSLNDNITYRKLSPEMDATDQGFAAYSYDLLVAFSMPSEELEIQQMLKNASRLLRPGGYFLCPRSIDCFLASDASSGRPVMPGMSGHCGQFASPSEVSLQRIRALEGFGFANIVQPSQGGKTDLDPQHSGVTFMQAINDRIRFLRDPLSETPRHLCNLAERTMLIGDETTPTSACADKISEILQPCTGLVIRARSISSLTDAEIRFDINNSVIVLQDHDKPLFDNFDESALAGLKKLFATSRNVLWITHGYKRNETHARMFVAFARCLVQEMGHVRLQILDFESPDALDAELISRDFLRLLATAGWEEQGRLDEILWSVEPEIAYEEGYAFVPRVKPSKALNDRYNSAHRTIIHDVVSDEGTTAQIRVQPVDHGQLFQCDKAYWLVGLTGDLGLSLCQWMITKGARHIALSSRHPKVDPAWLTHFRSLGATVKVLTCDVTEFESVQTALSSIEASMPPIAGVCHGAMVLQDALFHDLDMPRVEQVLKPKVDGAVNLDKAFRNRSLDFFVLLSSIAAITGNAGQSIYAAANGFLAGLGAQRRARGESATTINLGPILGAGAMRTLNAAQQKKLEKDGVMWTSEQDFHTAFAEAVAADRCSPDSNGEFTTGVRMCSIDEQSKARYSDNPLFSHMSLCGDPLAQSSSESSPAGSVRAQLLQAVNENTVSQILEDFLTTKLLKALQMPSDSSIVDKTADVLGIDSLIAIEMRSWLLKELGVDLPLLIIIGGNNMRQVLEVCRTCLDPGMLPLLQASKSQTTTHEVQYSHEESRVEVSHDQQPPVTSANASPTAFGGAPEADTGERHDAEVTGTIVSPTYVPLTSVQQHGSNKLPAAANAEPDAKSVPISDRVCTEQKAQRVKSGDGPDALSRADSSGSSLDDIETGRSAQPVDMKGGTVHVRSVHGGSPEGSTQSQGLTKRKGLLGRVLRSRRFARLRGYV